MSSQSSRRALRKSRREYLEHKELLLALDQETDLQRANVSQRTGTLYTRASILIAAASLSAALQSGQQGFWFTAAVWLSVVSAILGALVLLPRVGEQLNVQQNEEDLWNTEPLELKRDLMYQKLRIIRKDEKALLWRRRVLVTGFLFLAASLASAAIHLSTNLNTESEPNGQETVVSSTATTHSPE